MALSLTNLSKNLGQDLLKIAEKLKARECEETEVGHFVSFIEEGQKDFDVSVILSPKGVVTSHSCDCGEKVSVCRHKAALLLFLAGGRKSKSLATPKKKESIAEALFRQAEPETVKVWLLEMFARNKDLELLFTNRFKPANTQFTPSEVKEATLQAAKSLIKNKKKLEQLELKKIIELWEEVHKPIVNQYLDNVSAPEGFQLFHSVLVSILETVSAWHYSGNKVTKYIEGLMKQSFEAILALHQPETKQKALLLFVDEIAKVNSLLTHRYLDEIFGKMNLLEPETIKVILQALMEASSQLQKNGNAHRQELLVKMLVMVSTYGLFARYKGSFDFIHYENRYNELLIKELILLKEFDKAEKICKMAFESNYYDSFNWPYNDLLKEIYTITSNQTGLLKLIEQTLPITFDFEDFKMVYEPMPEGDAKKTFRTRLLSKARASYSEPGENFAFELAAYEEKFKKMIEYIRHVTPTSLITKYMEPMATAGKFPLLKAIFERDRDRNSTFRGSNDQANTFSELTQKLLTCYTHEELRLGIANQKVGLNRYQAIPKLAEYITHELNF